MDTIEFHSIFFLLEFSEVHQLFSYRHSSKDLLLCSAEEKNRFETT